METDTMKGSRYNAELESVGDAIMIETLIVDKLRHIAELQAAVKKDIMLKQELNEAFEEYNKDLFSGMRDRREELGTLAGDLREDALSLYNLTGSKKLVGGVGIRISKVLEYDKEDAFNWAVEHKMALSLDTPAFERIAKTTPIDLVRIWVVPKATIPAKIDLDSLRGAVE